MAPPDGGTSAAVQAPGATNKRPAQGMMDGGAIHHTCWVDVIVCTRGFADVSHHVFCCIYSSSIRMHIHTHAHTHTHKTHTHTHTHKHTHTHTYIHTDPCSNPSKMAKLEVASRPVIITTNPGTPPPPAGTPPPQPNAQPTPPAGARNGDGGGEATSLEEQVCICVGLVVVDCYVRQSADNVYDYLDFVDRCYGMTQHALDHTYPPPHTPHSLRCCKRRKQYSSKNSNCCVLHLNTCTKSIKQ